MTAITLSNINKRFGEKVLFRDYSLHIEAGEFVAIKGESGAGKTTLLNIIGLLETPDSGSVTLCGARNPSFSSRAAVHLRRHKLSYLFQNYGLVDTDTVEANMKLATRFGKAKGKAEKERIADALAQVGLSGYERRLRTQQEYGKEQKLKIADYENYIEKWAHEIKKPLSLMTLLLDNRKGEMSPLVHTRMLYVRDYARQSVEQILYFSRLGAVHKDYCFEQLSVLETCREAVEDNFSLLEEAGFSVVYTGDDRNAVSDKKGFMFILGQIISNSVKYAGKNPAPTIQFSVADHADSGEIILSISDNGTGIPVSDLPFVFDKGFTGDTGSYLSRSTGMGLYLVRQMANDLTLKVSIFSNANGGTTVTLMFPKVEQPLRR